MEKKHDIFNQCASFLFMCHVSAFYCCAFSAMFHVLSSTFAPTNARHKYTVQT